MRSAITYQALQTMTGREAFKAVITGYLDCAQHKEPALSLDDIDKIVAGLSRRPDDSRTYHRLMEALQVAHSVQCETRLLLMEAIWRLTSFAAHMTIAFKNVIAEPEREEKLLADVPMFREMGEVVYSYIKRSADFKLLLDAFSEMLDGDMSVLTDSATELLADHVDLYNTAVTCLNHKIWRIAASRDKQIDDLPLLVMPELPVEQKQYYIEAIERAGRTSYWEVFRLFT